MIAILITAAIRQGKGYPFPNKGERSLQSLRLSFVVVFSYGLVINTLTLYTFILQTVYHFHPVYPTYLPQDEVVPFYMVVEVFIFFGLIVSILWYTIRPPGRIGG
jgi:hypothetical protein